MVKSTRKSGIELCRIVAMSMIVIHHFFLHVLNVTPKTDGYLSIITSLFLCGVNLFFMISGYFGIRCSISKIISLISIILILGGVNIAVTHAFTDIPPEYIYNLILFPISKSPYWFIQVYLLLMVCAPILNQGLNNMEIMHIRKIIIIFTILTIWSCAIGHNISNPNGYTFLQGLYMYIIGHWLSRDKIIVNALSKRTCMGLFILFSIIGGFGFRLFGSPFWTAYNGLPLISASICLFIYFLQIKIQNDIVNKIAHASLYVYLLQDGIFGEKILYSWQRLEILSMDTFIQKFLFFVISFITLWLSALFVARLVDIIIHLESKLLSKTSAKMLINKFNVNI